MRMLPRKHRRSLLPQAFASISATAFTVFTHFLSLHFDDGAGTKGNLPSSRRLLISESLSKTTLETEAGRLHRRKHSSAPLAVTHKRFLFRTSLSGKAGFRRDERGEVGIAFVRKHRGERFSSEKRRKALVYGGLSVLLFRVRNPPETSMRARPLKENRR